MTEAQKLTMSDAQRILERCRDTLLLYEQKGWLNPERTANGTRIFERAEVEALRDRIIQESRRR